MLICYNALVFFFFCHTATWIICQKDTCLPYPLVFLALFSVCCGSQVYCSCDMINLWAYLQILVCQTWHMCIFNSNLWTTFLPMTSFCWMYTVCTVNYTLTAMSITLLKKSHFWHIRHYLYFLWPKNCFCLIFTHCKMHRFLMRSLHPLEMEF